jgi:hypothetical protein
LTRGEVFQIEADSITPNHNDMLAAVPTRQDDLFVGFLPASPLLLRPLRQRPCHERQYDAEDRDQKDPPIAADYPGDGGNAQLEEGGEEARPVDQIEAWETFLSGLSLENETHNPAWEGFLTASPEPGFSRLAFAFSDSHRCWMRRF